jgi:hypothetical protein
MHGVSEPSESILNQAQPRPHASYNQSHLSNGANTVPGIGATGGPGTNFLPNNGRVVQTGGVRILCIADVRGMFCLLTASNNFWGSDLGGR